MIVLMGSVGSGKSEQAIRLAAKLDCPRISTSQLLRDNMTPEIEQIMQSGQMVSDKVVLDLLDSEFKKIGVDKNEVILDGSPRSLEQAKWFVEQIKSGAIRITAIIKLNVSTETVIERLSKRGREDDQEQVIRKRIENFEKITLPVIDYLRQNGVTVDEVDGELSPDGVAAEVAKIIEAKSNG